MGRQRTIASLVIAVSVCIAICTGCKAPAQPPPAVSSPAPLLRLGYRPKALADITPVIIKEMGIQSPQVRVELVPVPDPATALQKLASGEADAVAGIPLASVLGQMEAGQPGFEAYYHQVDVAEEGWVSLVGNAAMGVKQIADLAGKPVAALPTPQAQWLVRRILVAAGIPKDRVKVVVYNPATPLAGMEAKEHAAIFGLEPAISQAAVSGNPVLARGPVSKYLYGGSPVIVSSSLLASRFTAAHPEAVKAFEQMVDEAVGIAKSRPDEIRSLFSKRDYGELAPNVVDKLYLPVMVRPSAAERTVAERYVDDLLRDGLLKKRVDLAPLFPGV
jgi:ABC-type nitrate/sulfonate/bicarbonate transport system substrate-binding protein